MGIGNQCLSMIVSEAKRLKCSHMFLTVNKDNKVAIGAYEKWGFTMQKEVVTDIGEGFVMDDYLMSKPVL